MPDVTLYDPATGRIKMTATLSTDSHRDLPQALEPRIEGHYDGAGFYVQAGAAAPRPANPATLTGSQLTGLPSPCTINVNGTDYPCTDATADLALGPGTYDIRVSAWPMLDATFTLRV